ncbi:TetR/AcrR family transcriptional regulator [Pseudomonas cavernae]|uniref:TetR/AcrR family transcriptional regulator n=1 Tax=Pseudomonas cavernae TaxID=2320867 RepID=A0A385Z5C5_9PSED|nr:TetR/AcrR family transcriptional regulator [Pseudomonas cavernae]AYC33143.1 TetR/AcrR family transcriptional regulator [Pseudomonas cavernae]
MRYPDTHKAETNQRIISEAAERFRRDGIGATGLQPLMKALGLTHGGFYAHFKSKDDLVQQALRAAADKLDEACAETFAQDKPLQQFIDNYLSGAHRANPGAGCPLPTMAAELGQRGQPSPITDEVVRNRLGMIEGALPGPQADEQSVVILSALVGALLLSRSVEDSQLSDQVLHSTQNWLKQAFCCAQA